MLWKLTQYPVISQFLMTKGAPAPKAGSPLSLSDKTYRVTFRRWRWRQVACATKTWTLKHAEADVAGPFGTLPQGIYQHRSIPTSVGPFKENLGALPHGNEIIRLATAQAVESTVKLGTLPSGIETRYPIPTFLVESGRSESFYANMLP